MDFQWNAARCRPTRERWRIALVREDNLYKFNNFPWYRRITWVSPSLPHPNITFSIINPGLFLLLLSINSLPCIYGFHGQPWPTFSSICQLIKTWPAVVAWLTPVSPIVLMQSRVSWLSVCHYQATRVQPIQCLMVLYFKLSLGHATMYALALGPSFRGAG